MALKFLVQTKKLTDLKNQKRNSEVKNKLAVDIDFHSDCIKSKLLAKGPQFPPSITHKTTLETIISVTESVLKDVESNHFTKEKIDSLLKSFKNSSNNKNKDKFTITIKNMINENNLVIIINKSNAIIILEKS